MCLPKDSSFHRHFGQSATVISYIPYFPVSFLCLSKGCLLISSFAKDVQMLFKQTVQIYDYRNIMIMCLKNGIKSVVIDLQENTQEFHSLLSVLLSLASFQIA